MLSPIGWVNKRTPYRPTPVSSPLDAMLRSYSRLPIPSREEQVLLGRAIRAWLDWEPNGDDLEKGRAEPPDRLRRAGKRARDQLVERNMLLVARQARAFSVSGLVALDTQDLIQEGAIGLCRAAEKFDPALGYTFSTYAALWIRQSMTKLIHGSGSIRIPQKRSQAMHHLRQWAEEFAVRMGRSPTDDEMLGAGIAGVSTPQDLTILRDAAAVFQVRSLDATLGDDEDCNSYLNLVAASRDEPEQSSHEEWKIALEVLQPWPHLKEVLQRRLMGQTFSEIGHAMKSPWRTAMRRLELALLVAREKVSPHSRVRESPEALLLETAEARLPKLPDTVSKSSGLSPAETFWQPSLFTCP